uniref:Uncharacterized protein n=1 Tax=Rhizophora mucronata TaxID=61149 RepID=A0A2P2QFK2_RHIMU
MIPKNLQNLYIEDCLCSFKLLLPYGVSNTGHSCQP